jgi:hypothetical protein
MSNYRHGMEATATYRAWSSMKQRCLNQKCRSYPNYGGRGIKVCGRWMTFKNFFDDMGEAPLGYSLERVDNNGNYEPGNCKWIPLHEQKRNRRATLKTSVNGVEMTVKEACLLLGLNYRTVQSRVNIMGWSMEEALGRCAKTAQSPAPELRQAA